MSCNSRWGGSVDLAGSDCERLSHVCANIELEVRSLLFLYVRPETQPRHQRPEGHMAWRVSPNRMQMQTRGVPLAEGNVALTVHYGTNSHPTSQSRRDKEIPIRSKGIGGSAFQCTTDSPWHRRYCPLRRSPGRVNNITSLILITFRKLPGRSAEALTTVANLSSATAVLRAYPLQVSPPRFVYLVHVSAKSAILVAAKCHSYPWSRSWLHPISGSLSSSPHPCTRFLLPHMNQLQ